MNVTSEALASGILTSYSMFEQGRYNETIILAEGLLTIDNNNPYLRSLLASAYFKQNRLEGFCRKHKCGGEGAAAGY